MRVLAVSLRSQLWAPASLVGRSGPRPRRTAAGVGWIKAARAQGGASGADGSLCARVGGPLWAVGGLGLAPSLGMWGGGGVSRGVASAASLTAAESLTPAQSPPPPQGTWSPQTPAPGCCGSPSFWRATQV